LDNDLLHQVEIKKVWYIEHIPNLFFFFAIVTVAASRSPLGVLRTSIGFTAGEREFSCRIILAKRRIGFIIFENIQGVKEISRNSFSLTTDLI
jgi:hypothetical protein